MRFETNCEAQLYSNFSSLDLSFEPNLFCISLKLNMSLAKWFLCKALYCLKYFLCQVLFAKCFSSKYFLFKLIFSKLIFMQISFLQSKHFVQSFVQSYLAETEHELGKMVLGDFLCQVFFVSSTFCQVLFIQLIFVLT